MSDINQFTFTGRLGADPESRALPSGEPVCNFRVACGESWKDKQTGEKKEIVEWVGVAVFGKLSEICTQYLRKGSQIAGSGKLRTRKWQDKNGVDRYTTEVILNHMTMMGGKPEGQRESPPPADRHEGARTRPAAAQAQAPADKENFDDDIPF